MKKITLFLSMLLLALPLACAQSFVKTNGTQFVRNGKPYHFIGTNFWYGPILASQGAGGDRARLAKELDGLKALGIDNLRILVGADDGSRNVTSVHPVLQPAPGVLNDTLLDGLDYLIKEMESRDMVGVFYLTNSWDWSGGYGFYLKNTGHEDSPDAHGDGYDPYCQYASQFYGDMAAVNMYERFVASIVSRTNRYTHRAYKDEPAIMAWQLCNEPRPFNKAMAKPMLEWSRRSAKLIKSIDPNHLVSTGSEGLVGCDFDTEVCQQMHLDENIDYLTVHVWPVNWGWSSRDRLREALPNVYLKAGEYLEANSRIAEAINKPAVVEEFGYSRDHTAYTPGSPTYSRDCFYNFIFTKVKESAENGGPIAGCNFWGWGGTGRPVAETWKTGDNFLCDPPHEPQGWYSVFDCDTTTIDIIRGAIKALK